EHGIQVTGCVCPNCRFDIDYKPLTNVPAPSCNTGDRVLVAKYFYDTGLKEMKPFDVVVFKFPEGPQQNYAAWNYIKRLIGRPGETTGTWYGALYVARALPHEEPFDQQLPLRRRMDKHNTAYRDLLQKGDPRFQILRKPPDKILSMYRLVYDNDHPPR